MRTILIWIIVFLVTITTATALEMCGDQNEINENCSMLTPEISCTNYTYKVYTHEGVQVQAGDLVLINDSIYYFNFSQPEGDYIVKLCDGTTREVTVEHGNKMLAIIIGIIGIAFVLLFAMNQLDDRHLLLKIVMMFVVVGLMLLVPNSLINGTNSSETMLLKSVVWFFRIFATYVVLYFLYHFWIKKKLYNLGFIKQNEK